ncbi:hypothetical protein LTR10_009524 [Elasticomyces elasticus]|nr:hypothetical protein LTR10_009524 [Elasticomyces elasticus]KAK4971380.1 hypothetical protein LTR42_007107 [Elasticomyces elasticus]
MAELEVLQSEKRNASQQKIRRARRACDFCHRRSIRCRPSERVPSQCQNCEDYNERCSIERPVKKRGVRPVVTPPSPEAIAAANSIGNHTQASQTWHAPHAIPQALVIDLAEIYFEIVYPIFPLFHQPTTLRRIARGEHHTNCAFSAAIMAMCALSSARARDGAVLSAQWDLSSLTEPSSESFFAMAKKILLEGAAETNDVNYLRACALLSIVAIQYGQPRVARRYLGLYHTATEEDALHDESHWPKGIGVVETEERRRLYWSMYTLDVFMAIVFGGVVRSREAQANVLYPRALDDNLISNEGYAQPTSTTMVLDDAFPIADEADPARQCWVHGWNFTTDLYRILEHVIDHFRRRRPEPRLNTHIDAIFGRDYAPGSAVLDAVLNMYQTLPTRFKQTPLASEATDHRLNFQTANIAATIQLVRMMLFAAEDATVEQRCCVASELLQAFSDIPVIYLRAISSPLLHHLAGIGTLLGSVFDKGLPESSYQHIRAVLSSMARLLADLEVNLYCTAGASIRVQSLIDRIDEFIRSQRQVMEHNRERGLEAEQNTVSTLTYANPDSPLFLLPSELLEDWSWAFDFAQSGT